MARDIAISHARLLVMFDSFGVFRVRGARRSGRQTVMVQA